MFVGETEAERSKFSLTLSEEWAHLGHIKVSWEILWGAAHAFECQRQVHSPMVWQGGGKGAS